MSNKISDKDLLKRHIKNLDKSIERLLYSYNVCNETNIKCEPKTEEYWEHYEALTARYGRSVDILVNNVLRYIDVVEYVQSGSIIDITNRAEKRGFVNTSKELRLLKDLRNDIVHNYDSDDYEEIFEDSLKFTPELIDIVNKVKKYCENILKDI
jgi:uncharacterized protein YutE (UPF0331/DUF86 family)